jgi:hypothetical protein
MYHHLKQFADAKRADYSEYGGSNFTDILVQTRRPAPEDTCFNIPPSSGSKPSHCNKQVI